VTSLPSFTWAHKLVNTIPKSNNYASVVNIEMDLVHPIYTVFTFVICGTILEASQMSTSLLVSILLSSVF
jgi:hypothetical protein